MNRSAQLVVACGLLIFDMEHPARLLGQGDTVTSPLQVREQLERVFRSQQSPERQRVLAGLSLGVHHLEDDPLSALQYLGRIETWADADPDLSGIGQVYGLQARMRLGYYDEVIQRGEEFLKTRKDFFWQPKVLETLLQSLFNEHKYSLFISYYNELKSSFGVSRNSDLRKLASIVYLRVGHYEKAYYELEDLVLGFPFEQNSIWAFHTLVDRRCAPKHPYVFSRALLTKLARNAEFDMGLREFLVSQVDQPLRLANGVVRTLTPMDQLQLLFDLRLYDETIEFAKTIQNSQADWATPRALYKVKFFLGRALLRTGRISEGQYLFSELLANHQNGRIWIDPSLQLADSFLMQRNYAEASRWYRRSLSIRKSHMARWGHFWTTYRSGDWHQALNILNGPFKPLSRDGDRKNHLLYWTARIQERLGKPKLAARIFRTLLSNGSDRHYALMTALRRPEMLDFYSDQNRMSLKEQVSGRPALDSQELGNAFVGGASLRGMFTGIEDLLAFDLKDAAKALFTHVMSKLPRDRIFDPEIIALADQMQDYSYSLRAAYLPPLRVRALPASFMGISAHQELFSTFWRLFYPIAYVHSSMQHFHLSGLDPLYVLSIMRAESRYDDQARSWVGARGLMQIMPYTALRIARRLGDDEFEVGQLLDPAKNIEFGAYYLDLLKRHFGNNRFVAAAAYNAGPEAAEKWLRRCQNCELDEFIEEITYRETRRYTKKILRHYARYYRIYHGSALPIRDLSLPKRISLHELF